MEIISINELLDISRRLESGSSIKTDELISVCTSLHNILDRYEKLEEKYNSLRSSTTKEIVPLDNIERDALKQDIEAKRQENLVLKKELNSLLEKTLKLDEEQVTLEKKLGYSEEQKLLDHLQLVENKFKEKFDNAFVLRTEGKLSEYGLTALTLGYHLVYSAKIAYQSALKEAKELLEKVSDE